MEENTTCAICDAEFTENNTKTCVSRGKNALIAASVKRNDNKHLKWEIISSLYVHENCRKKYINVRTVEAAEKRKRSVEHAEGADIFDFEQHCFICGKLCNRAMEIKKKLKHRRNVFVIPHASATENQILNSIRDNNDEWAQAVNRRITNASSLYEVKARYHWDCRTQFLERKSHRAKDESKLNVEKKFTELIEHMETSEECQWTIDELRTYMDCDISEYYIRKKLEEKYGDHVIFTSNRPHSTIVTFKHTTHQLLRESFDQSSTTSIIEKRRKIIELAANIINEEICEKAFNNNTYPAGSAFLDDIEDIIPESLQLFLEEIILKRKKNPANSMIKITSIAHAIIAATRPRSFTSPLLLALSIYVHRKFESKLLINILSKLGFGDTYNETMLYEASATMQGQTNLQPIENVFLQYAFDNADYDIHTVDGRNTFHYTGGIECITPHSSVPSDEPIPRLVKIPEEQDLAMKGSIPIKKFKNYTINGLSKITILDLDELHPSEPRSVQLLASEILWVMGKWLQIENFPEWNGFMEYHTSSNEYEKSTVRFLPFINLKSSDDDALFTALTFAINEIQKVHQGTTFVTFDQPLYIKARNIVATIIENDKYSESTSSESVINSTNIVVKLGGFHLLMSFLGAIGYIMQGSGLKEAWSLIYAEQSIDNMMSGKSYSRAVRAHILTQCALLQLLLDKSGISPTEQKEITTLLQSSRKTSTEADIYMQFVQSLKPEELSDRPTLLSLCSSLISLELENKLKLQIESIEAENGPTAKLWLQYINLVSLVKTFIIAERMGDWKLHLSCIQNMLPYFHSTGHNLYAKSAHLYLQDMIHLEKIMTPQEYERYTKKGYFTIRRTNKFWSGVWTDMTIEQTLMRSMHSRGGITRGRGITESVVSSWINAMPTSMYVCDALENLTEVKDESSEQHKDFRDSSIRLNEADTKKLLVWFQEHPPFIPNDKIMSLATGVCGNTNINCWNAKEIGMSLLKSTVGQNFADVTYKRSKKVQTISSINSGIKVGNTRVTVNPTFIFQRMLRLHPSDEELKTYFYYELSPFPPALFDEAGMRKTISSNFDIFTPSEKLTDPDLLYIIDGEWLLNHITWQLRINYATVYNYFIEYIKENYGEKVSIVFNLDRNYAAEFPKFAEQKRMNSKYNCQKIVFDENKVVTVHGNKLLTNSENKNLFITQLYNALTKSGINCTVLGATNSISSELIDADVFIIHQTLQLANKNNSICIVTNNADFLYTLTSMAPLDNNIYIMKIQKNDVAWFSINDQRAKYPHLYPYFAILHALSGCSTTSALFSIGKKTVFSSFKKLITTTDVAEILNMFNNETSTMDTIKIAGEQLMLLIYKAPPEVKTLNDLRCSAFHQLVNKSKKEVSLSNLPPTSEAAYQHCYRTYYQVQLWRGTKKPAESWGWYNNENTLSPLTTTSEVVPDALYEMIACGCTTGCKSNHCICKKNGLKCTYACKHCSGSGCENSEYIIVGDNIEETNSLQPVCEYPSSLAVLAEVTMDVDDDQNNQPGCSKHQY